MKIALILSHSSGVKGLLSTWSTALASVTGYKPISPRYFFCETKYQIRPINIPVPAAIKPYFHLYASAILAILSGWPKKPQTKGAIKAPTLIPI